MLLYDSGYNTPMNKKIYLLPVAGLILLNVFAWQEVFALAGTQYLHVTALDIGQGDSIFIQTPNQNQIIVDGGPNSAVLGRLQAHMPFWDRSLDMVVLTHPDADHLAGLLDVLKKYKVDYILWTGIVRDGQLYQKWVQLLKDTQKKGTRVVIAKAGQKIVSGNVVIDIVHPFENLDGKVFGSNDNDTGIVSHVVYGNTSFLLTADISGKEEQKLVDQHIDITSDVLKVAHHGSKYSSSEEFLQAVHPGLAVISVGAKNTYGHPTPEVLQRLEKFGIRVLRTDQHGDVEILSDGNTINIKR